MTNRRKNVETAIVLLLCVGLFWWTVSSGAILNGITLRVRVRELEGRIAELEAKP